MRKGGNRVEGTVILKKLFIFDCACLHCGAWTFSVAASRDDSVVVMRWLLAVMASLLQSAVCRHAALVVAADGLSSCGSQALERGLGGCGTWP